MTIGIIITLLMIASNLPQIMKLIKNKTAKDVSLTMYVMTYIGVILLDYKSILVKDKDLIIAYKMNGIVLPPERGYPFILVAEDKLGYKWAKWITEIELSDNSNYRGYWEKRGFSNEADV